ncbi:MAG: hypothetical protein KJ709_01485 [Nanoarchaeota archaeon]|nr:hypothetical protein [Nanoarchaeota archaeon]
MKFMTGFKKGFADFGHTISAVVNSILLTAVYLIGVGLTALFAKLFKRHFLNMKLSEKRKSYWVKHETDTAMDQFYRQF